MVALVLMERDLPVVVGMLLGAGIVVRGVQMKRGMGVAARERERQQQDDAAQEQGPLHGTISDIRGKLDKTESRIARRGRKVKPGPNQRNRRVARPYRWAVRAKTRAEATSHCSNGATPVPSQGTTGIAGA